MATVKAVVALSDRKLDGTCNAKIRITHKRKSRYIKTPFYIPYNQVTKGGKIKDRLVSDKLDEEVKRYRSEINKLGFVVDSLDVDGIISLIKQGGESSNFFKYAERHIDKLRKNKREGTATAYTICLKRLETYNGSSELSFTSMTRRYMDGFIEFLSSRYKALTVSITINAIKTIYNSARNELNDDETGVSIVVWDCFSGLNMKKDNSIEKRSFDSIEEMQKVIDCITETDKQEYAKDLFVFSFVCFGINMADISRLKKTDIKDGILTFRRKKVENLMGDRCLMKVKLPEVAKIIIEKHSDTDSELLFRNVCRNMNWFVGPYISEVFKLAGVSDRYVFYTARHSMATFARNICGIDMFTVNEMLDHAAPQSLKMTDVYVKRDYSHLWAANEKLLNLFDWSSYLKK